MRAKIRNILRQIVRIYPASKLFGYLLDALKSKNSRTRTECLEELGELVKRNGMGVCVPSKAFPVIAAQIADSDAKVRNAAIGVVTQSYILIGDLVYKNLGRLSEKDKSMIEEKIKRLPAQTSVLRQKSIPSSVDDIPTTKASRPLSVQSYQDSQPAARQDSVLHGSAVAGLVGMPSQRPMSYHEGAARASQPASFRKEFSLDFETSQRFGDEGRRAPSSAQSMPDVSQYRQSSVSEKSSWATESAIEEANVIETPPTLQNAANIMDYIIAQITAGDAYKSIEALKELENSLTNSTVSIRPHLDEVISAITLQIRIAFTAADIASAGTARLCKHLVNVLVQVFSVTEFARAAGIEPMQQCIQELLVRLLDPHLQQFEHGPSLARALNILMVRILENCDRNKSFRYVLRKRVTFDLVCLSVLLNLMQQSTMATLQADPSEVAGHAKYTELVMKCVWKMTKVISQLLEQNLLDPTKLLLTIHEFLEISPPSDWKRRLQEKTIPQADMPLRTIKTILHEIVSFYGDSYVNFLSLIPDPQRSHAVQYLKQLLEQEKKKNGVLSKAISSESRSEPASLGPSPPNRFAAEPPSPPESQTPPDICRPTTGCLTDEEADHELTVIFARIGQKDETKQGIADLYAFKKRHPECESRVAAHLGVTGNYFQGYIKRGLAALEADERDSANTILAGPASADLPANGNHKGMADKTPICSERPRSTSISAKYGLQKYSVHHYLISK
ncbi:Microtubule-associated protein, microtubule dynamics during spindle orientation [Irineochytrium annulatum]|nr:Microtubule-associated protein, microtubule dynamics during spindle orientation [Irineochytrium annulatum]